MMDEPAIYQLTLTRDDIRDIAESAGVSRATMFWILDGLREGVVPVEPDAWGITTWRQLYDNMKLAENGGDWIECTDALGAALGIGGSDE